MYSAYHTISTTMMTHSPVTVKYTAAMAARTMIAV